MHVKKYQKFFYNDTSKKENINSVVSGQEIIKNKSNTILV